MQVEFKFSPGDKVMSVFEEAGIIRLCAIGPGGNDYLVVLPGGVEGNYREEELVLAVQSSKEIIRTIKIDVGTDEVRMENVEKTGWLNVPAKAGILSLEVGTTISVFWPPKDVEITGVLMSQPFEGEDGSISMQIQMLE